MGEEVITLLTDEKRELLIQNSEKLIETVLEQDVNGFMMFLKG